MIASEMTLAEYQEANARPPAFEGSDGRAYSVGVFSDDDPDAEGQYGASLLFIRWSASQEPDGHLESDYLAHAVNPADAEAKVGAMTLAEVKAALDGLIARREAGAAT